MDFSCFICLFCFCFVLFCFFSLFLGIVVFYLFVFWFFIYLFFINSFFFVVAASGREGCVLGSCCVFFVFFLLSFCRGEGYFILRVGGVRDSSSAGQSLT